MAEAAQKDTRVAPNISIQCLIKPESIGNLSMRELYAFFNGRRDERSS
jgi:hypothetical protein